MDVYIYIYIYIYIYMIKKEINKIQNSVNLVVFVAR